MNDERRAILVETNVRMAIACVRVRPLARFYIEQAKRLLPPARADSQSAASCRPSAAGREF